MSNQATVATASANTTITYGQFGGKYQTACSEIYEFLTKQYGLTPAKSHKIAHMFACDYGAAMKSRGQEDTRAKVGKATKEGIVTLRDATTNVAKGVAQTAPLAIAHAIQWIGDAGKHGVHYGESTWKFVPVLDKWITELAE